MGARYFVLPDRHGGGGFHANPVRRPDGKCIVGNGSALVVTSDGTRVVVLRRRLRLNSKLRAPVEGTTE